MLTDIQKGYRVIDGKKKTKKKNVVRNSERSQIFWADSSKVVRTNEIVRLLRSTSLTTVKFYLHSSIHTFLSGFGVR